MKTVAFATPVMWLCLLVSSAMCQGGNNARMAGTRVDAGTTNVSRVGSSESVKGGQPLVYIENRGQWDSRAKFLLRSQGMDLWITDSGVVYDLHRITPGGTWLHEKPADAMIAKMTSSGIPTEPAPIDRAKADEKGIAVKRQAVYMTFTGTLAGPLTTGNVKKTGYHNYLIGNDPTRWATHVPTYSTLRMQNIYEGIDAVFYTDNQAARYDLVLSAGADPQKVRMKFDGADSISTELDGTLMVRTSIGSFVQKGLVAYQVTEGVRRSVECKFKASERGEVTFDVGEYDRSRPLVIDPLMYSTDLGGGGDDIGQAIAVDASDNAYVTGYTYSANYPTSHAEQSSDAGGQDAFVSKYDASGRYVYSTYIGGDSADAGEGIAVNRTSNAYITGYTYSDNYPTHTAVQTTRRGREDSFVTELSPDGSTMIFSTYYGGDSLDAGTAIAVDSSGTAYITGYTYSNNFPTHNAVQGSRAGDRDGYVTRFVYDGTGTMFSTYQGGSGEDAGQGIAVDTTGNAYVTGYTYSTDYPTVTPMQSANGGGRDGTVTKYQYDGLARTFSTYVGGSQDDSGQGIAVDTAGRAIITGYTYSDNYPVTSPVQPSRGGDRDGFVTRFSYDGTARTFSTYVGGSGEDAGDGVAVDQGGRPYVTGYTYSDNYPVSSPVQSSRHGNSDAIITSYTYDMTNYQFSTYLGGSSNDVGAGIAVDISGRAFVTGYTFSPNFPTDNAQQPNNGGGVDAFVAEIAQTPSDGRLPVELAEFSARPEQRLVEVSWRTASEVSNAGFEVDRAASDSLFTAIASYLTDPELAGLGTTSQGKSYSYLDGTDQSLQQGATYLYRLVDIALDGTRTLHPAVSVTMDNDVAHAYVESFVLLPVIPNPAMRSVTVEFRVAEQQSVTLEVLDLLGSEIATIADAKTYAPGSYDIAISLAEYTAGTYMLRMTSGNKVRTERFLVVR